jgi:hypothetical protein
MSELSKAKDAPATLHMGPRSRDRLIVAIAHLVFV